MTHHSHNNYNEMSESDYQHKWRLVWEWDGICIVCGTRFANIACVTVEHIIPKSRGGTNARTNKAPSHYRCNQLKGSDSLLVAAKQIERKKESMHVNDVRGWLNKSVPARGVPAKAKLPIVGAACLEPSDERLPGMPMSTKKQK